MSATAPALPRRKDHSMFVLPSAAANARQALMVSGCVVQMDRGAFVSIVELMDRPVVVMARTQLLRKVTYTYATSYKGFVFFTRGREPLHLPQDIELIAAGRIWMPNSLNI
jgi:uncharacterized protein (DUF1778 family)